MAERLPYETSAGSLSPADTFSQLLENLSLAEEDLRLLASACKGRGDAGAAAAWLACADNFRKVAAVVRILAQARANPSSIGYLNANKTPH